MTSPTETLQTALFGNPADPNFKPVRLGVLEAFTDLNDRITSIMLGIATYATVAALPAVTTADNGDFARVYADPTEANNTFWVVKAGAWVIDTGLTSFMETYVAASAGSAAASAGSAAASAGSAAASGGYANATAAARDAAVASNIGQQIYATKALATAALSTIPTNAYVRVLADESQTGFPDWLYQKVGGALVSRKVFVDFTGMATTIELRRAEADGTGLIQQELWRLPPLASGLVNPSDGTLASSTWTDTIKMTPFGTGADLYYCESRIDGFNCNPNGSVRDTSKPATYGYYETKYTQTPSDRNYYSEWHIVTHITIGATNAHRVLDFYLPYTGDDNTVDAHCVTRVNTFSLQDWSNASKIDFIFRNASDLVLHYTDIKYEFSVNNAPVATQRSAAGGGLTINLPYINDKDETQISSAFYIQAGGVNNSAGVRGVSVTLYTNPQAGDTARYMVANAAVTGNFTMDYILGDATGSIINVLRNTRSGGKFGQLILNNGGAGFIAFEDQANGSVGPQIVHDTANDRLRIDADGYRGNGATTQGLNIARTTGQVTFFYPLKKPNYTVAGLPNPAMAGGGAEAICSNETDGYVPVFSDGTNWRRVTDRAIAS